MVYPGQDSGQPFLPSHWPRLQYPFLPSPAILTLPSSPPPRSFPYPLVRTGVALPPPIRTGIPLPSRSSLLPLPAPRQGRGSPHSSPLPTGQATQWVVRLLRSRNRVLLLKVCSDVSQTSLEVQTGVPVVPRKDTCPPKFV